MDRERMLAVADLIEAENRFDLNVPCVDIKNYYRGDVAPAQLLFNCDTVGCVAGWTCAMFMPDVDFFIEQPNLVGLRKSIDFCDMEEAAGELLDLTSDEATYLFYPSKLWGEQYDYKGHYTAKEAALLLRGLANGEISFPDANPQVIWHLQVDGARSPSELELVDA